MPGQKNKSHLEDSLSAALDKRRAQFTLRQLTTNPSNGTDFSSNDFLSLSTSQALRQEFLNELRSDPTVAKTLGSGGSRLLDGNSEYAERLEREIAAFHGASTGLLCNSGFDANVGLFSCLPQPGDVVVYDEFIHASVHDGMRLSRAKECVHFAHNSIEALRGVLERVLDGDDETMRVGRRNCFVAVEAVYSMDGDVAPLREIADLVKELFPCGNGHLIVDEAHSTGVFGAQGRGLVSQLDLEKQVTVRLHTFGKALACNGAVLLCSPLIRQYLLNYARPMIYTTFMSYPALAAIQASYRFLVQGMTEPLVRNLEMLVRALHVQLLDMQASLDLPMTLRHLIQSPLGCPTSPIFAVLTSAPKALAASCQKAGFVIRGIVWPTVPVGTERVRICLHAGNTLQQIEGLVNAIRLWVERRVQSLGRTEEIKARL